MTARFHPRPIAFAALVALCAGTLPAAADGQAVDDAALAEWRTSLAAIRDMTPQWGVQGVDAFRASSDAGVPVFYLDVRRPGEWQDGIVEGAVTLGLTDLPTRDGIAQLPADRSTIIAVYCKSGHRSALALPLLHQLGYANAISMKGGYEAWVAAGHPVTGPAGD